MKSPGKSLEILKMQIKTNLAYSSFMWSSLIVGIIQVVVFYFVWTAVYGKNSSINGISKVQMITYVILSRILISQISWGINLYVSQKIRTGDISIELLRPVDFQFFIYMMRLGDLTCYLVINGIPALVFSMLLFGMQPPVSASALILFIFSLLIGITISFFFEFFVGTLTFFSKNGWGMQYTKMAIMDFFSGSMVPLAFLPGWLKTAVDVLPFKDMIYTPVSIYLGLIKGDQILKAMLIQLMWVFILFLFSRAFYRFAIKKVTVQGG